MTKVLIGGGRSTEVDGDATPVGDAADAIAERFEVPGGTFTFKVDGIEVGRDLPCSQIATGVVELIEANSPGVPDEPRTPAETGAETEAETGEAGW